MWRCFDKGTNSSEDVRKKITKAVGIIKRIFSKKWTPGAPQVITFIKRTSQRFSWMVAARVECMCTYRECLVSQSALPQSGKSVIAVPSLQSPTQQFPRYLNLKASHTLPASLIPHAHVTVLIPGLISCYRARLLRPSPGNLPCFLSDRVSVSSLPRFLSFGLFVPSVIKARVMFPWEHLA